MSRSVARWSVIALIGVFGLAWSAAESRTQPQPGSKPPAPVRVSPASKAPIPGSSSKEEVQSKGAIVPGKPESVKSDKVGSAYHRGTELRRKLAQVIDITDEIGAGPLRDAMELLTSRYHIEFQFDEMAFKNDLGIADVANQPITLRKSKGIRLRAVLQMLFNQVGGTFFERDGLIVITSPNQVIPEAALSRTVDAVFDNQSFIEACQELADLSGVSIIIDDFHLQKERTKAPMTATLTQVPVDTAVRLLADMADAKAVVIDAVIYVTTKENAKTLHKEQKGRKPRGLTAPASM